MVGLQGYQEWIWLWRVTVDLVFIFRPSSWMEPTSAGLKIMEVVWRKIMQIKYGSLPTDTGL